MTKFKAKKKGKTTIISGSARRPFHKARPVKSVNPNEIINVTVTLKPRDPNKLLSILDKINDKLPENRHYLSPEELERIHGASEKDLEKVRHYAKSHNLKVVDSSSSKRSIILSGTAEAMESAFGTKLALYKFAGGTYRGREGSLRVPKDIANIIVGVHGLDSRPQFIQHSRTLVTKNISKMRKDLGVPKNFKGYTPPQVAKLYNFPDKNKSGRKLDGKGQCIGIVECGGGYDIKELRKYFDHLGIPMPKITSVLVGDASNSAGVDKDADGEVMLDLEVAASVAPGAQIVVYFAEITTKGVIDAILQAVHQAIDHTEYNPSVISISWGYPEDMVTAQLKTAVDLAFQDAAALGKTILIASGDWGVSDESTVTDSKAHVDFPSTSPYSLVCGGTQLFSSKGKVNEIVWNDKDGWASGGGISEFFPRPKYQNTTSIPRSVNKTRFTGRAIPDVSANADLVTGYIILVDGKYQQIGGTSAVAPLWAALIAIMNQTLDKPVGFLNTLLYKKIGPGGLLRDIIEGNNNTNDENGKIILKGYTAKNGWDACTGWGSPDGKRLLDFLSGGV
jgi:kumamolisin